MGTSQAGAVVAMIKEVLVLSILCALFGRGQTNKKSHHDVEVSFTNGFGNHASVKHRISANEHEITVGQKVITLPWPLTDGWKDKVKFGQARKGKKGLSNRWGFGKLMKGIGNLMKGFGN